ncbi:MAG: prephenate dehydrogenase [Treponema sp.]|nr:prephenate dehydrogenase [Treponema sp.]
MQTFGIAGLGLMGGAIALSLRDRCSVPVQKIFACDKDTDTLNSAQQDGIIAKGWLSENAGEMLSQCDVVFLCLNPSTLISFLEKWETSFKSGCLITDIAGTKGSIAAAAEKIRDDIDFIPGHPMAGTHVRAGGKTGFANSAFCDFTGKNYIITPLTRNKKENLVFLKDLIYKMGFANITEVAPIEHDQKIAFTSQLCHVIAASLIDCEPDTEITRFGGGSFEDLTRIAMLNAPMWTELFIENRALLLERIEQFKASLDTIKSLIGEAQAQKLEERLSLVRERREDMANRAGK